eukprot:365153_1
MCLICVGDFLSQMLSVSDVIGEIRTIFSARGDLPADVPKLLPRRNIVVPLRDHPCAGMFTDPEISYTSLGLEVLSPVPKQLKTIRDFRNLLIEELFQAILSLRLRKRALQPNPPFLSGVCESYSEIGNLHSIQLSVQCTELGAKTAMEATLAEVEDIRLRGISHAEISKAIQDMKAQTQSSWVERGQLDSGVLSDELKNLFLKEIAAPGIEWEAGIEPTLLNGIKMDEVQAVVNELHWGNGTIIYLIRPSIGMKYLFRSMLSSLPSPWWNVEHHHLSENDLLTILKSRKANDPKSGTLLCNSDNNEDEEVDSLTPTCFSDLIPNDLVSGDILNRVEHPGIGSIEIELSNGMHVLYKETSFQDDEVVFCGFAYGGLSEYISYKDSSYSLLTTEARMANAIAEELGILGIIPAQVDDLMAGSIVSLASHIAIYGRNFTGEASSQDLELALEMMYRFFTCELLWEEDRLRHAKRYAEETLRNSFKNPFNVFRFEMNRVTTCNHPHWREPTISDIHHLDPNISARIFREAFLDPSDFTVVICGAFSPKNLELLCCRYLANIPSPSIGLRQKVCDKGLLHKITRAEVHPLSQCFPLSGITRQTLKWVFVDGETGISASIILPVVLGGVHHPTHIERLEDHIKLEVVNLVLERRLLEVLRFELGSVYNVNVNESFETAPPIILPEDELKGMTVISFTCRKEDFKQLQEKILSEIKKLATDGPEES